MNWLILILSGIVEIGVTFCLGKASKTVGSEKFIWGGLQFVQWLSASI